MHATGPMDPKDRSPGAISHEAELPAQRHDTPAKTVTDRGSAR